MQAPVVANNILHSLDLADGVAHYNGYGSCPLTVERGKIVLAEFGYGGKLLPPVYWQAMLKGKEWMVEPKQAAPSSESV
jgi:sulfide:quinone oxidoreductase